MNERRGLAQTNLVQALRDRANLGGNLYGGRSALDEGQQVADLQNQFAEEDIQREERAKLNSIQAAIPYLQLLFPDVNISSPQFSSPVQGADTYAGGLISQRGQNMQAQSSADASRSALYGALFQGLGSAAGGVASKCWVASELFGGWFHPKTIGARIYVTEIAPKWFERFYTKHGEHIALFISNKPILKIILKPVFEIFSYVGRMSLRGN